MPKDWFDYLIIVFIIAGIAAALWKGGQANPVGTGSLGKDFAQLKNKVSAIDSKMSATDAKLSGIENQVDDLERRSAKASDIERLERQMSAFDRNQADQLARMAELSEMLAATKVGGEERGKQLDRLYDFIVQRGMSK